MQVEYKSCTLKTSSYQLTETKKWKARISIISPIDKNGLIPLQPLTVNDPTYNTKEDADTNAINFGKEIIDGKHPEFKLSL